MPDRAPVSYTEIEVRGHLPGGWSLASDDPPPATESPAAWSVTLIDIADMEWPLTVSPKDVEKHGRVGALRQAIDRVYREALG